ncbi:MAG: hypothetical protein CMN78_02785 [Spirochaetales bacterium]|nr:hypothetical protein [Spirochaetales bacterium]
MKGLIRFVDRSFLLRFLYLSLFYSLVPLGEIVLILYLRRYVGFYLLLAGITSTGLLGLGFAWRELSAVLVRLRAQVHDGTYPGEEYTDLAGAVIGSLFLLTPGFVTDFFGLLFLFPLLRRVIGRHITRRMDGRLKELYEYLKLYYE